MVDVKHGWVACSHVSLGNQSTGGGPLPVTGVPTRGSPLTTGRVTRVSEPSRRRDPSSSGRRRRLCRREASNRGVKQTTPEIGVSRGS